MVCSPGPVIRGWYGCRNSFSRKGSLLRVKERFRDMLGYVAQKESLFMLEGKERQVKKDEKDEKDEGRRGTGKGDEIRVR